jgi:acetyl-CoA synthetase
VIASVGEALNPAAVVWGKQVLSHPIQDNWWQTETGAIMISNYAGVDIRPGSVGLPGVEAGLLAHGKDGRAHVTDGAVEVIDTTDVVGELVLRPGWPSPRIPARRRPLRQLLRRWLVPQRGPRPPRRRRLLLVCRAGRRRHQMCRPPDRPVRGRKRADGTPAVAEAGVIGKPDEVAGELVKAFVTLRPAFEATDELRLDLLAFGRRRLGAVAPKEIGFDQNLPHTRSGKVMRRVAQSA